MSVTLLGFGGRSPPSILQIVSSLVKELGIVSIIPIRSQSIELDLLQEPYRTFLKNDSGTNGKKNHCDLLVYCLPTSFTEYSLNHEEAARVRSAILRSECSMTENPTIAVLYDATKDIIVGGGSAETLLKAVSGDAGARQLFASASLTALGELDSTTSANMASLTQKDLVIVVGSGGREHAIAVSLAKSPLIKSVICCPGNGGTATEGGKIANMGENQATDTIVSLVKKLNATMVVVGPEQPLVDGLVNVLAESSPDVLVFGPTNQAAQLEASKAFAKDFLNEYGIPTASYRNFSDLNEALSYVETLDIERNRMVVKASGLAAGKGVLLPTTKAETLDAVKAVMSDKAFGDAGDTCVIESFMTGPEASCLAFCDGKTAKLLPAAQDHKRALDNDEGLNTGGMGAYAPAPCVTALLQNEIEAFCIKTVEKMAERGTPYVGILYAGMMLTPNGPSVLEFNCRFGDPETQVVLPLLETDLYEVMRACCTGNLSSIDLRFKESTFAATVVCAAKGYPESYPKGMEIKGIEKENSVEGAKIYHAGTNKDNSGSLRCTGGRVLAVTGVAKSLEAALQNAYSVVRSISFVDSNTTENLIHYRSDIGRKALGRNLRIGVIGSTRGTALLPVIEACANGDLAAEIVAVLSDKNGALILEKGKGIGPNVLVKALSSKSLTREQYDAECTANLLNAGVDFVLLVGYMRILSKPFTDYWKGRCVNVHPSLLPKHAGGMDLAVHQAVIDAKEDESGCTIHYVTDEVDGGPIVVQRRVKVDRDETAESLKAKIQPLEGPAFVEAIRLYCNKNVISYADAGVSIDAGNQFVDLIKPLCKSTRRAGCDADLGGFGGLFDLAAAGYNSSETILIGATDGVGTKLKIAQSMKNHKTIGIDLVAMCVNDLIVAGGEPLFFLDYFATSHLNIYEAAEVVEGIAEGCRQAECGLIGGETAEMPSMYAPGEFDLAGFAVGAVHRDRVLPRDICEGDMLIGLPSSGIHSNGFSLVRKLIERAGLDYESQCPWDPSERSVGEAVLVPTKIYVKSCLPLIKRGLVKGLAHITGGGLLENLPRSLPNGVSAEISFHPALPKVFRWMQQISGLDDTEMLRTFNCGIGMVLIIAKDNVTAVKDLLRDSGEKYDEIGSLVKGEREVKMLVNLV